MRPQLPGALLCGACVRQGAGCPGRQTRGPARRRPPAGAAAPRAARRPWRGRAGGVGAAGPPTRRANRAAHRRATKNGGRRLRPWRPPQGGPQMRPGPRAWGAEGGLGGRRARGAGAVGPQKRASARRAQPALRYAARRAACASRGTKLTCTTAAGRAQRRQGGALPQTRPAVTGRPAQRTKTHSGGPDPARAQISRSRGPPQITPASSRRRCTSSLTLPTMTPPLRLAGSSTWVGGTGGGVWLV